MSIQVEVKSLNDKAPLFLHKIHFSIKKRVKYGQAVFVSGHIPSLGSWQP
jgi:hypothetical protein